MPDPIRTPDDEVDKPGYFYPPFKAGDWYQGATYPGHSDYSVDWNRRTKNGGWLDDRGDPVLAAADGTVADVEASDGTVTLNHHGGLWRTVYRHMQPTLVKVGDKVKRGDIVGRIGEAGNAPNGTHLHHEHWKRDSLKADFQRTKQRFYGDAIEASVGTSNTTPAGTDMPGPVMVQGPPPPATWEDAYKEAAKRLTKTSDALERVRGALALATEERDTARGERDQALGDVSALKDAAVILGNRIAELEATTPVDCDAIEAERDQALADLATATTDRVNAETARDEALARLNEETDRAVAAEAIVETVRRAVAP